MEENIPHKNWFNRNWKWVVPTSGCLLIVILFFAFIGTLFYGVTSLMSDSQAYTDAMEKAKNNITLIERIGEPIETNGMTGGSIHYSNGFSTAEITIPIKGPKGDATIQVEGKGNDTNWTYDIMNVYIPGTDETINLLNEGEF